MSYVDVTHLSADEVRASLSLWRGVGLCVLVSPAVAPALADVITPPIIASVADDHEVPVDNAPIEDAVEVEADSVG